MARGRVPSFAALRAFDAVARHLSFTDAAEEISVSQAAVSRQVKNLESELGVSLIVRGTDGNSLTESGRILAHAVERSFDDIADAVRAIARPGDRSVLTVSIAPYFSAFWLAPRLFDFFQSHPNIDLQLQHSYVVPDYRTETVDLGINWGPPEQPGVTTEKLLDGSLTPSCSPKLVGLSETFTPGSLLKQKLYYEFDRADWVAWFKAAGIEDPGEFDATRIDDSHALRRLALEEQGVALFFRTLAKEDCAHGILVQPFDIDVDTGAHYYLTYRKSKVLSTAERQFRSWLLSGRDREPNSARTGYLPCHTDV